MSKRKSVTPDLDESTLAFLDKLGPADLTPLLSRRMHNLLRDAPRSVLSAALRPLYAEYRAMLHEAYQTHQSPLLAWLARTLRRPSSRRAPPAQ